MKDKHILEILDRTPPGALGGDERRSVAAHTAGCADCRRALDAARLSEILLKARADAEKPAPNAFFQSKVMNALRERQNLRKPIAAFRRWWQISYPLVGSMLFVVAALAGLSAFAPRPTATQAVSNYNLYTTDAVILNQRPPRQLTTEQTLEVIYTEQRRDAGKR